VNAAPPKSVAGNLKTAVSVDIMADGNTFKKNNIAPGHSVQQVYKSNETLGKTVAVTGTITPKGGKPIAVMGLMLTVGYKNTFYVDAFDDVSVVVS